MTLHRGPSLVRSPLRLIFLGLVVAFQLMPALLAKVEWDPITPAETAATQCDYSPGASAEMLFVRQVLDASGKDEWTNHYRRIKIYSAKAAADLGVMNIEYGSRERVWDVAARVIKPNGAISQYDRKDFNETVAVATDSAKLKRLTLAVPALDSGDILELKWSVSLTSETFLYSWWYSQLNLPVRSYSFSVKATAHDCRLLSFNSRLLPAKKGSKGIGFALEYVPSFEPEPYAPAERDIRGWFLLLYTDYAMRWYSSADVWKEISTYREEEFRLTIRPESTIKAKAAEIVAGATSDDEKLKRLYDFCQQHVSNADYFDSAELQKFKKRIEDGKSQSPKETLARGMGYSRHVNELFASLAKAAGFDVAQGLSASKYTTLNVQNANGWMFMKDDLVCVRLGQELRKFAPGDFFIPGGMLDQSNESAPSLICTEDKAVFDLNHVSPAMRSPVIRKGRFTLDADGNLEGEIEVRSDGHPAIKDRKARYSQQQQEIDTDYIETIVHRLPSAEVTDLAWENLRDNRLPLVTRYKLRLPAYADVAGNKIILPLDVFQHNAAAVFTTDVRRYPVIFPYAWSEEDDIEIVLPEGFALEAPSSPPNVGDVTSAFGAAYTISYRPGPRTLSYRRNFVVGANGQTVFQTKGYPAIKKLFDRIKLSDEHTLVLQPMTVAGGTGSAPAATNGH